MLGSAARISKRNPVAHAPDLAVQVVAPSLVVDPIAVADVEAILRAVPPDRVLHEPGEELGEPPVELTSIDLVSNGLDDGDTTAGAVAGRAVRVCGSKPVEDAGPVQEIVNQGVDRDMVVPTSAQ